MTITTTIVKQSYQSPFQMLPAALVALRVKHLVDYCHTYIPLYYCTPVGPTVMDLAETIAHLDQIRCLIGKSRSCL